MLDLLPLVGVSRILSPFLLVLRLLQHEDVAVELLLQHLVREVDAQLLEAVANHDLEPCHEPLPSTRVRMQITKSRLEKNKTDQKKIAPKRDAASKTK